MRVEIKTEAIEPGRKQGENKVYSISPVEEFHSFFPNDWDVKIKYQFLCLFFCIQFIY